ncbi:MAG TPA: phosphotransferase family protein [Ilumatobacter sp.]|jgi:aminoglycoside phosphotransferase (APT) family kinase protein|nr:phosphotransferase family protein [Ilumatobacter sp.]
MVETIRAPLQRWLGEQHGSDVSVVELRRIATGNSRANWYVETADGARYVVRVEQGGVFGSTSAEEFRMMRAAHAVGCPVARVRWLEPTGAVLGQPFFAMDFVDGITTARNDRSMAPDLAEDFVRRLADLHQADWRSEIAGGTSGVDTTHAAIDRWHGVYRAETDVRIPLLEEGAAWLHHHAEHPESVGIVHGDAGPGNFVHDGTRVTAFTDWEFAHVGDPMEDWAYLITMRGASTMSRNDWLALFERVAGVKVSERQLRYWSVFNFFKGACANLTCRRAFRTVNPAPNMALIGTALHQTYVRQVARLIEEA